MYIYPFEWYENAHFIPRYGDLQDGLYKSPDTKIIPSTVAPSCFQEYNASVPLFLKNYCEEQKPSRRSSIIRMISSKEKIILPIKLLREKNEQKSYRCTTHFNIYLLTNKISAWNILFQFTNKTVHCKPDFYLLNTISSCDILQ